MKIENHEEIRLLVDKSSCQELSQEEASALENHLHDCAACQEYKSKTDRVVRALEGFSFVVAPELNAKVERSMLQLAERIKVEKLEHKRMLLTSSAAFLLSLLGSSVAWQFADFLAVQFHLPVSEIQTGVFVLWIAPSLLAAFLLPLIPNLLMNRQSEKGWTS
jgi:anti-sigma factor RsiW